MPYVTEAVHALTQELGETPLIGFAGAPFTLASYLVEGGPSKNHARTKALMHADPRLWHDLLDRLATITLAFLRVQVDAGASAVQLFDSWVGALPGGRLPPRRCSRTARGCWRRWPTCPASTSASAPASCCTTWARRAPTSSGSTGGSRSTWPRSRVGPGKAVQGNLDPTLVHAPTEVVRAETERILAEGRAAEGHVFNLGHGVLPETDPDVLARVVDHVHEASRR